MEKVSITITTDKPVKISVTPTDEPKQNGEISTAKQNGLDRLLRNVKEGGYVAECGKDSQGSATMRCKP